MEVTGGGRDPDVARDPASRKALWKGDFAAGKLCPLAAAPTASARRRSFRTSMTWGRAGDSLDMRDAPSRAPIRFAASCKRSRLVAVLCITPRLSWMSMMCVYQRSQA